jgi:hypothetical protein
MIPILLTPACVPADGLQVSLGQGTDPYIRPGRRNCQISNAAKFGGISLGFAPRPDIPKALAAGDAANPGHAIRNVSQARNFGGFHWI